MEEISNQDEASKQASKQASKHDGATVKTRQVKEAMQKVIKQIFIECHSQRCMIALTWNLSALIDSYAAAEGRSSAYFRRSSAYFRIFSCFDALRLTFFKLR